MKKRILVNGFIMFATCFLIVLFPAIFLRKDADFSDELIEVTGIVLILLGQIVRVSARGYKAENSKEGMKLIQDGPYSLVRNPMYLGIILIGSGVVLMLFQWWAVPVFGLFFITRYCLLISKEEKKLFAVFPEYRQYCQKTPRLFPKPATLIKKDISGYLPLKLTWFKKEIISIILLLAFVFLIESWEDIRQKGFSGYLKEMMFMAAVIILFITGVIFLAKRTNSNAKKLTGKS